MKRSDVDTKLVLKAVYEAWIGTGDYVFKRLEHIPPNLLHSKLEWMCLKGLINYGVSVNFPWLTKEGYDMLHESE